MKKILFVIPSFEAGGTNTSLLSIIDQFGECDIMVFPIARTGSFKDRFKEIPTLKRNLLLHLWYGNYIELQSASKFCAVFIKFVKRIASKFRINIDRWILKHTAKKNCFSDYDIVIGFQEGIATQLASYIPAKMHVSWIHCNLKYSNLRFRDYDECYKISDKIVCVSESGKKAFDEIYPFASNKSCVIYNLINTQKNNKLSLQPDSDLLIAASGESVLVSVGRLDPIKQFDIIPMIASQLKQKIKSFKWFIIGDGSTTEKNIIYSQIKRFGVEDVVFMTGYKDNPFPFYKRADLYVCTSKSEACPMVFLEANSLDTFVITNDFPSAHELVSDNGIICDLNSMSTIIAYYLTENKVQNVVTSNVVHKAYENIKALLCDE